MLVGPDICRRNCPRRCSLQCESPRIVTVIGRTIIWLANVPTIPARKLASRSRLVGILFWFVGGWDMSMRWNSIVGYNWLTYKLSVYKYKKHTTENECGMPGRISLKGKPHGFRCKMRRRKIAPWVTQYIEDTSSTIHSILGHATRRYSYMQCRDIPPQETQIHWMYFL